MLAPRDVTVYDWPDFTDGTEMWLDEFDTADFRDQLAALWEEVTPLYQQLHAFVRGRLRTHYGDHVVSKSGPIPAHLLGEDGGAGR